MAAFGIVVTNKRIIDIGELNARLSFNNNLLRICVEEEEHTVPLHQIGAVIISSYGVVYTHAVLAALADANIPFVCCNAKHQPVGMLLSLHANSIQTQRMAMQISIKPTLHKKIWQHIVQAKITAQGAVLKRMGLENPLQMLVPKVQAGDVYNIEAQAARIYWQVLFGSSFIRDSDMQGINSILNYGYAVVRAITARNLVALGLHPAFGIHHHNKYDAFPLANDVMEPFRALVDEAAAVYVFHYAKAQSLKIEECNEQLLLSPAVKKHMLTRLNGRYRAEGASRTLADTISITCDSLLGVYLNTRSSLQLPLLEYADEE